MNHNPLSEPSEDTRSGRSRTATAVFVVVALFMGLTLAAAAPQADAGSTCSGAPSQNVYTARANYKKKCGETWDGESGVHKCDYGSRGYTCSGPKATNNNCSSNWSKTFKDALAGFHGDCGVQFDYRNSSHHCAAVGGSYQFQCWRGEPRNYKNN